MTVGVVFVTHNAKHHLPHSLSPILDSPIKPRVLVMNSSSRDGTVELAKEMGAETLVIPRNEFNHGLSREKARKHLGTDIVVMMTPDAYACDKETLGHLIKPITEGEAAISYARQIPHDGAGFFESFPRAFNYPSQSHIRSFDDRALYGVYTIFCSDSCAAYSSRTLDEAGGFSHSLIGEDTFAAAKLLKKGYKIAYAAQAVVKHSHRYTLRQEFQRHFDTGLARKKNQELLKDYPSDEKRARRFVFEMLKKLKAESPLLIPYALVWTGVKYLGYRIGKASQNAPLWFKRACSGQDFYWKINR